MFHYTPTTCFRSSYYPPKTFIQPILRPVQTESFDGRLPLGPLMSEHASIATHITGVSSTHGGWNPHSHCAQASSRASSLGSPFDSPPQVGRHYPPVSCSISVESGYTAVQCPISVDLPPLQLESGGSRRNSPQLYCGEGYVSSSDSDDELSGLPEVLNRLKLARPQISEPGSDVACHSTPSPHPVIGRLPEKKQVPKCGVVKAKQRSNFRKSGSEKRNKSRQQRYAPPPLSRSPMHLAVLQRVLDGTPLSEITVLQIRQLIRKHPVPKQLRGKWQEYAVYDPSLGGKKDYRCVFSDKCHYEGKKQLVQRHIEGVHLKIKQHHCPYCDAKFHQETCAVTHISSIHLRVFPYKCAFGCGRGFNDVARRHRHYRNVHFYVPKQVRNGSQETGTSDVVQ